jgi:hypothetical protein
LLKLESGNFQRRRFCSCSVRVHSEDVLTMAAASSGGGESDGPPVPFNDEESFKAWVSLCFLGYHPAYITPSMSSQLRDYVSTPTHTGPKNCLAEGDAGDDCALPSRVTQMTAGNKLSRKENAVPDFNEPDAEEIETIKKLRVSNALHLNRVGIQVLKNLATACLVGRSPHKKGSSVPPSTLHPFA